MNTRIPKVSSSSKTAMSECNYAGVASQGNCLKAREAAQRPPGVEARRDKLFDAPEKPEQIVVQLPKSAV